MAAKSRRAGPARVREGSSSSDPPEVKGSLCPAERGGRGASSPRTKAQIPSQVGPCLLGSV